MTYNPTWSTAEGTPSTTGKKAIIFGDSISLSNMWVAYISSMQLASATTYAVGGARYHNSSTSDLWMSTQLDLAITNGETPDIIIFAGGTNDLGQTVGDYATAMGKATLGDLDLTKFYEALRWHYWKAGTQWTAATLYSLLPLQRADVQVLDYTAERTAMISMANRYDVLVIDQTVESGIVSDYENIGSNGRYLADGVHPNTAGKQLQGKYVSHKVMCSYII